MRRVSDQTPKVGATPSVTSAALDVPLQTPLALTSPDLAKAREIPTVPATAKAAAAAAATAGKRAASPTGPLAIQHLQRIDPTAYVQELRDGIVSAVIDGIDHFRAHPKQLGWAIMNLEIVTHIGQRECGASPKTTYDLVRAAAASLAPADEQLLREAAFHVIFHRGGFADLDRLPAHLAAAEPNKTFEAFARIERDPSNEYARNYESDLDVAQRYLGTPNGDGWTANGYLACAEPGWPGVFAGYSHVETEVPSALADRITAYRADPMVAEHVAPFVRGLKWAWQGNFIERAVFEKAPCVAAKKGAAAVDELRYVSYVNALLKEARTWTGPQWMEALRSNVWHYRGVDFDVSQITLDHRTDPSDIADRDAMTRFAEPGESVRHELWGDWVHAVVDQEDPEFLAAKATILKHGVDDFAGRPQTVTPEELASARAVVVAHQPNRAHAADLAAAYADPSHPKAALFNRNADAAVTGWAAIARIVEMQKSRQTFLYGDHEPDRSVAIYGNAVMMTMPDNVHPSFKAAAIELARAALDNPADEATRANAAAFLAKHG
jgi:hypothetical protein